MTALQQIYEIAEWQTYRGTCDGCREKWSTVCRIARDASQTEPEDCRGAEIGFVIVMVVTFAIGWAIGSIWA